MRILLLVATVGLFGCGGAASPTPTAAPPDDPAPAQAVWTGDVSEQAFRDLHQLSQTEVPPLQGQTVELAGTQAYLSLPEGEAPFPAVLVIHEWWGLNDHIRHWADRLAADGYAALAVDLYRGEVATEPSQAMELMRAVDDEQALVALRAGAAFLADDARVSATRRASIGWCFGGGWSLRTGLAVPEMTATVMYYGRPVTDPEALSTMAGPLLAVFGNQDDSLPPATVDEFDAALGQAGVDREILRYDAQHAFANPSSARYDHAAAGAAWERVRAFLRQQLSEPASE